MFRFILLFSFLSSLACCVFCVNRRKWENETVVEKKVSNNTPNNAPKNQQNKCWILYTMLPLRISFVRSFSFLHISFFNTTDYNTGERESQLEEKVIIIMFVVVVIVVSVVTVVFVSCNTRTKQNDSETEWCSIVSIYVQMRFVEMFVLLHLTLVFKHNKH